MNNNENWTEYIISNYQKGKSISQLIKEVPFCYSKIRSVLIINNIPIKGGRKRKELSEKEMVELLDLYRNKNYTLKDLSKKYNLHKDTIKLRIQEKEKENWKRDKPKVVNKQINSNYFSHIDTEAKAYFLGLLFTDGSVDKNSNRSGRIRLSLQTQDKNMLEKFHKELNLSCKLTRDTRGNGMWSLEFNDNQI